jgi:hypothetical protein
MPRKIGLDVGGVLTDSLRNDGTDTSFRSDNFMATSAVPGSFEAVATLVQWCGAENVFIISKCGKEIERKTRLWLGGNGFYSQTGFWTHNLYFCPHRADKAPIAAELGLTDFVDDHAEVLAYMDGIVNLRYLFGPQAEPPQTTGLIIAPTWSETLRAMREAA